MNRLISLCSLSLLSFICNGQQTEKSLRTYFEKAEHPDPIEGVWKVLTTREFYHYDTLYNVQHLPDTMQIAVIKTNESFGAYYLNGNSFNLDFTSSDVKGVYMYRIYYPLISEYSKKWAVICTHGKMEFTYDLPPEYVVDICGREYKPNTRVVISLNWKKGTSGKP